MNTGGLTQLSVHTLRPHAHIPRQYAFAAVASLVPIFLVLYWLTVPPGAWLPVLIAQALVIAAAYYGAAAYKRTTITVTPSRIIERSFFGRMSEFEPGTVGSVILLELYRSGALDSDPQLFLVDPVGNLLLRMRGQFWPRSAMETIIDQLEAPVVRVPEPMSLRDLNRLRPELLYWFERRLTSRTT
ncbi:MAG: hypothetical protein JWQ59_868 [Cryobacterium sp.]|nr:hypothetical protein [Cryobacterium sp.]